MLIRRLFVFCLFLASTAAIGRPAPWYWWVSDLNNQRICQQTSPGSGWTREPRPFKDSHCSIRLGR
jgi:hypothetical protein